MTPAQIVLANASRVVPSSTVENMEGNLPMERRKMIDLEELALWNSAARNLADAWECESLPVRDFDRQSIALGNQIQGRQIVGDAYTSPGLIGDFSPDPIRSEHQQLLEELAEIRIDIRQKKRERRADAEQQLRVFPPSVA